MGLSPEERFFIVGRGCWSLQTKPVLKTTTFVIEKSAPVERFEVGKAPQQIEPDGPQLSLTGFCLQKGGTSSSSGRGQTKRGHPFSS